MENSASPDILEPVHLHPLLAEKRLQLVEIAPCLVVEMHSVAEEMPVAYLEVEEKLAVVDPEMEEMLAVDDLELVEMLVADDLEVEERPAVDDPETEEMLLVDDLEMEGRLEVCLEVEERLGFDLELEEMLVVDDQLEMTSFGCFAVGMPLVLLMALDGIVHVGFAGRQFLLSGVAHVHNFPDEFHHWMFQMEEVHHQWFQDSELQAENDILEAVGVVLLAEKGLNLHLDVP